MGAIDINYTYVRAINNFVSNEEYIQAQLPIPKCQWEGHLLEQVDLLNWTNMKLTDGVQ